MPNGAERQIEQPEEARKFSELEGIKPGEQRAMQLPSFENSRGMRGGMYPPTPEETVDGVNNFLKQLRDQDTKMSGSFAIRTENVYGEEGTTNIVVVEGLPKQEKPKPYKTPLLGYNYPTSGEVKPKIKKPVNFRDPFGG